MDIKTAIHILRNPCYWSQSKKKEARLLAATELEKWLKFTEQIEKLDFPKIWADEASKP